MKGSSAVVIREDSRVLGVGGKNMAIFSSTGGVDGPAIPTAQHSLTLNLLIRHRGDAMI